MSLMNHGNNTENVILNYTDFKKRSAGQSGENPSWWLYRGAAGLLWAYYKAAWNLSARALVNAKLKGSNFLAAQ